MKNYKQFDVIADPFNPEFLNGVLWQLDLEGITEYDDHLSLFVVEDSEISTTVIEEVLNKVKEEKLISTFSVREFEVETVNWNEEWEKNVNTIEVTDRIVIKPSFRDYEEKPGQIIIEIDPKMSFGTGEHETTKLMLKMIERYVKDGDKVLDVGCGTGVLGIAAAKLADVNSVLGVDNDEWCLLNGNENVELNKIGDKVKIELGELKDVKDSNFNLIVANINKLVLLSIAGELKEKLDKNGILLLSGLLIVDKEDILTEYSKFGFVLFDEMTMNEWKTLAFKLDKESN